MPRYYCDYCDTYLTHDSPSVRKQHNAGYKHKANIRSYYQKFEEQQTQVLIDQKIKEHLGQAAVYQQIGAAYNQHLAAFPGGRPRLPVMPPPMLFFPGSVPSQSAPGIRPAILPVPVPGVPEKGLQETNFGIAEQVIQMLQCSPNRLRPCPFNQTGCKLHQVQVQFQEGSHPLPLVVCYLVRYQCTPELPLLLLQLLEAILIHKPLRPVIDLYLMGRVFKTSSCVLRLFCTCSKTSSIPERYLDG